MREDTRVTGNLCGEDLVSVQRIVITGRAGVLDDLRACQIRDDHRAVDGADPDGRSVERHGWSLTVCSVRTPTPRAVTASSPSSLRYSTIVS